MTPFCSRLHVYTPTNIPVTYLKPAKWDSFTIAQQKKILQAWKELPGTLLSIFAINLSYAINVSYYTENKKDEFSNSIQSTSVVSITRADAQTSKVVNASINEMARIIHMLSDNSMFHVGPTE